MPYILKNIRQTKNDIPWHGDSWLYDCEGMTERQKKRMAKGHLGYKKNPGLDHSKIQKCKIYIENIFGLSNFSLTTWFWIL